MTSLDPFDGPRLPPLPRVRWERGGPVHGIEPRDGWTLHFDSGHVRTGYQCEEYVAIHEDGRTAVLNHCRFRFNPTQERWDWLVAHGFSLPVVVNGVQLPFTDWHIETEIEKEAST